MKKYIIIWGGPAWATLGNFLIKNWIRNVTIIEKEKFPRHHIWESIQPDILDFLEKIWIDKNIFNKIFPKKYWAIYKWWKYNYKWSVLYSKELDDKWSNNEEIFDLDQYEHGYNVDRSIFDKILLDDFINNWWKIIYNEVKDLVINNNLIKKIIFSNWEELSWDIFIDASWQNSIISYKLKLKIYDKFLRNSSIYGYYKWYKSIDNKLKKYFQYIENIWDCWYWWIPTSEEIVSVWIVFNSSRKYNDKDFFYKLKNTEIYSSINEADLVDYNGNKTTKLNYIWDWSFLSKKAYWNNWYLLWDSFWFVDPILSGWVSFAMEKAIFLWRLLILIEKNLNKKNLINKKYELVYKNDVLKYLKMAYLWYENWNSKEKWIEESGWSKRNFINFISGWERFLNKSKIFQDWQNDRILKNLI